VNARERLEDRLAAVYETFGYAERVVADMPRDTPAERKARAEKYIGVLSEWHQARRRWKLTP
jgi:hypothetical protein